MRINNNIMAMNTHRQYGVNNANVSKSVEKLSSGFRINRAGDDAAGLAISEKMRAQIRGLSMASKNSQDAISLVQTAEGALQETHNILQRMRELAVQSASDTNETTIDRSALDKEFQALIAEIDDTAQKAKFNEMGIIDGSFSKVKLAASTGIATALTGVVFHADVYANSLSELPTAGSTVTLGEITNSSVNTADGSFTFDYLADGDTGDAVTYTVYKGQTSVQLYDGVSLDFGASGFSGTIAAGALNGDLDVDVDTDLVAGSDFVVQTGANKGDELNINITKMDSKGLGVFGSDITVRDHASKAIEEVNNAINRVSSQRADLGALQNRLEHKIANLDTSTENLQAAESRIRDLDMAKEMTNFTKNNILSQAATAMLAQANALPQGVLQLLG